MIEQANNLLQNPRKIQMIRDKTRATSISHTTGPDRWAAKKAQLEELSATQASADIALVEAQRTFNSARAALEAATAAKTTAEKRLASFRANLGAE